MEEEVLGAVTEGFKAVQETAKLGGKAIDAASGAGKWLADAMGTTPEDIVGVLGGDRLRHYRIRNAAALQDKTERILRQRGIKKPQTVSPAVMVPLLEAAAEESREELQELWARLLAAAMEPGAPFREKFITVVKALDPLDAALFNSILSVPGGTWRRKVTIVLADLGATIDQLAISVEHLNKLDVIERVKSSENERDSFDDGESTIWRMTNPDGSLKAPNETLSAQLSALGRELARALR